MIKNVILCCRTGFTTTEWILKLWVDLNKEFRQKIILLKLLFQFFFLVSGLILDFNGEK